MEFPLVTNAIPLYRSRPFVDIIVANIHAITYPNVEIIISDRHQQDDAIDVLERLFANDPRVTTLKARDELAYAQHYNLLLAVGRGKYFRWMPHDDSYPTCCLKEKVEILESNPRYILVNGPWHVLDASGNVTAMHHPMKSRLGSWSFETAIFVAFGDYEAHAFKGLFRREACIDKGIRLFETKRIIFAERCWEYAMSLAGEFCCLDTFAYYKRYHAGSTHRAWQAQWRPVDTVWAWVYKYRYLRMLDGGAKSAGFHRADGATHIPSVDPEKITAALRALDEEDPGQTRQAVDPSGPVKVVTRGTSPGLAALPPFRYIQILTCFV